MMQTLDFSEQLDTSAFTFDTDGAPCVTLPDLEQMLESVPAPSIDLWDAPRVITPLAIPKAPAAMVTPLQSNETDAFAESLLEHGAKRKRLNEPAPDQLPPPVNVPVAVQKKTKAERSAAKGACMSPTDVTDSLLAPLDSLRKPTARRPAGTSSAAAQPLLAGLDSLEAPASDDGTSSSRAESPAGELGATSGEQKRQQRMRRNRESAAESRKRKRQRVEELEASLTGLKEEMKRLTDENAELRKELLVAGVCS